MAGNVVVAAGVDETILPIKETPMSKMKIDGIDAAINAIQPAVVPPAGGLPTRHGGPI
jgi:phage terminase large subunit-like protein